LRKHGRTQKLPDGYARSLVADGFIFVRGFIAPRMIVNYRKLWTAKRRAWLFIKSKM